MSSSRSYYTNIVPSDSLCQMVRSKMWVQGHTTDFVFLLCPESRNKLWWFDQYQTMDIHWITDIILPPPPPKKWWSQLILRRKTELMLKSLETHIELLSVKDSTLSLFLLKYHEICVDECFIISWSTTRYLYIYMIILRKYKVWQNNGKLMH